MNFTRRSAAVLPLLLAAVLLAAGCWSTARRGAGRTPTPDPVPPAFTATGTNHLPDRFWTAFGDPQLDALIERALAGNFTLRQAQDRLDHRNHRVRHRRDRRVLGRRLRQGARPLWLERRRRGLPRHCPQLEARHQSEHRRLEGRARPLPRWGDATLRRGLCHGARVAWAGRAGRRRPLHPR